LHQAHAIEQVAFAVQFDREVAADVMTTLRDTVAEWFEGDFPRRSEFQGTTLTIGVGPVMPTALKADAPAGYVFQRFRADGLIEAELRVDKTSIVYRTILYTRWADVWGRAHSYLDRLIPPYANVAQIGALGLNYVDKFIWKGPGSECLPTLLLRSGSPYICPHAFEARDLWHTHTGRFDRVDAITKRLSLVHTDYRDDLFPSGAQRVVAITSALTDMYNQPGYDPARVTADQALAFVSERIEDLHKTNKRILADIINEEMCKRIALEP
jgi:uncharacterized protein (TIGR04255 family)